MAVSSSPSFISAFLVGHGSFTPARTMTPQKSCKAEKKLPQSKLFRLWEAFFELLGEGTRWVCAQTTSPNEMVAHHQVHSPEARLTLIHQSAINYHVMAAELLGVVPVIHGWTEAELRQSFEWICDHDQLASGSNIATAYDWPPH